MEWQGGPLVGGVTRYIPIHMNFFSRWYRWVLLMVVCSTGLQLRAVESVMRQADFRGFTVITDAGDKEVAAWVAQFDGFRRVVQDLMQIQDEQLLPLTVVLLARKEDMRDLMTPLHQFMGEALVLSVGLGKQPMIATTVGRQVPSRDVKIRSGIVMWMLSSAGLEYDPWIVQGCVDFFGKLQIEGNEVKTDWSLEKYMEVLNGKAKFAPPRVLDLERIPNEPTFAWVALHYLLVGRSGWQGMNPLIAYQRAVANGVGRNEAFATAFGLDLPEANQAINGFLKRGRVDATRLATVTAAGKTALQLRPLAPGVRDCLIAQFMIQQTGADLEKAHKLIERAAKLIPGDVRLYETWWFYYSKAWLTSQAKDVLTQALRAGTRNYYLRSQWCLDQINDRMLSNGSFLCDPAIAVEAADTLADLIRANPHGMSSYRMLAQFVSSIVPARERDRRLLEDGRQAMPRNLLVNLGLVAWSWRHGDLPEARARLENLGAAPDVGGPVGPAYANWLAIQIEATAALGEMQAALAANDYAGAREKYYAFQPKPLNNPALSKQIDAVRTELDYDEILLKTEQNWNDGRHEAAISLLQSVREAALSPALRVRAEKLREKFAQKSTG